MEFRTEIVHFEPLVPFRIMYGKGITLEAYQTGAFYMHRHHCLEINYCVSGHGWYEIGDEKYPIEPGDIFIINNLEYHRAINEDGELQLLVLTFNADFVLGSDDDYLLLRAFYEWKTGLKHRIERNTSIAASITPFLLEIDQEWRQRVVGWKVVIKALLLKFLAILYRTFDQIEGGTESVRNFQNSYARIIPAISMIENHFREQLPLEQLAGVVHMNPNYFSTYFSNLMGCTLSEYLMHKRLQNATQLLVSTDNSVLSIAIESGFNSVNYFNRVFKKQYGISPNQYRKEGRAV